MKFHQLLFLLVSSVITLRVVGESQFKHERQAAEGDSVDFACQSQMIQKYQPAIKMSWSKDEVVIDHTSPRIRIDAGGNLHISDVTPDDVGTYTCLVTYWETTVTASEIRLHVGQHTAGGKDSKGLFGIPIPWVISFLVSAVLAFGWIAVVVVTKLRKGSGPSSKKYAPVPAGLDDEAVIDQEDEDNEEVWENEEDLV